MSGSYGRSAMSCGYFNVDELKTTQQEIANASQFIEKLCSAKEQLEQNLMQYQMYVQHLQSQTTTNGVQTQQQIEQHKEQYTLNEDHLYMINDNLNKASQKFLTDLTSYVRLCENLILNWTKDELVLWKRQQKAAQYGNPDSVTSLATLSERYAIMTDYVFTGWKYALRVSTVWKKFPDWSKLMDALQAKLYSCFYQLLNTSFLVIQQPPIITKNLINVRVGLLGAIDKFGFESQRTSAKCRIISEKTASELKNSPEKLDDQIKVEGTLKEKTNAIDTEIERLNNDNVLGFEFKQLKVKVNSRKKEAKTGEAIKQKYYLLFDSTVTVGEHHFKIFTLSLPFMVSVHGSQDNDLWAKAFWDMAFSDGINDIPMHGRPEVSWSDLSQGLKTVFTCIMYANTANYTNPRALTDEDLAYIKMRLFNGCPPAHRDPMISWTQFYEDSLMHMTNRSDLKFSFWEWFFRIADMCQEKAGHETKVKSLWNSGLIEGFVAKPEAERRLKTCSEPTFLLRFSDNNLGSISAVVLNKAHDSDCGACGSWCKCNKMQVDHLAPFLHKEEINDRNNLPACIMHCQELDDVNFIYPRYERKLIADQLSVKESKQKSGYVHRSSRTVVLGDKPRKCSESGPSTPAYAPVYATEFINDYSPPSQKTHEISPQPVSPSFNPNVTEFITKNSVCVQPRMNPTTQITTTYPTPTPTPLNGQYEMSNGDIQMTEQMSDEDLLDILEYISQQNEILSMNSDSDGGMFVNCNNYFG